MPKLACGADLWYTRGIKLFDCRSARNTNLQSKHNLCQNRRSCYGYDFILFYSALQAYPYFPLDKRRKDTMGSPKDPQKRDEWKRKIEAANRQRYADPIFKSKDHKLNYWTDEEDAVIIANYGKLTYEQIAALLPSRDWFAVRNRANRLNLTHSSNLGRKHCVNKEYFSVPNIPNSYWAGFLAADGYIQSERKRLGVRLHLKDANHVEKLHDALEYTGKVSYDAKSAGLGISCPEIVDDLEKNFNITPRKSFTLKPPPLVDENMIGAFIVGLIDGDGSIGLMPHPKKYPRIAVYGTRFILEWVQSYFDEWTPITNYKRSSVHFVSEHHLYSYRIGAGRAIAIAKRLAQLDVPRMERKWSVFNDYL